MTPNNPNVLPDSPTNKYVVREATGPIVPASLLGGSCYGYTPDDLWEDRNTPYGAPGEYGFTVQPNPAGGWSFFGFMPQTYRFTWSDLKTRVLSDVRSIFGEGNSVIDFGPAESYHAEVPVGSQNNVVVPNGYHVVRNLDSTLKLVADES